MKFQKDAKAFIALRGEVKAVTLLTEETHATNKTTYLNYETVEGKYKEGLHPDFFHPTREEAEKEALEFNTMMDDPKNPLVDRAEMLLFEEMKFIGMSREATKQAAKQRLKSEVEHLEAKITKALPNLSKEEAIRIFTIAHEAFQELDEAHGYAFQHGEKAYLILKERSQKPAPKKISTPKPTPGLEME